MIDFYFIYNFIKENLLSLIVIAILCFGIYIFWDKIEYLWEVEQGKREFFNDYHNNRQK
jgi:hypothetical protein